MAGITLRLRSPVPSYSTLQRILQLYERQIKYQVIDRAAISQPRDTSSVLVIEVVQLLVSAVGLTLSPISISCLTFNNCSDEHLRNCLPCTIILNAITNRWTNNQEKPQLRPSVAINSVLSVLVTFFSYEDVTIFLRLKTDRK